MRRPVQRLAAGGLAALTLLAGPASADQFLVDASERKVAITAGFTGADLVVFGTTAEAHEGTGDPHGVIVLVRGPREPAVVRQKQRSFGVWANRGGVTFPEAPAFVWLAASEGLAERPIREVLDAHRIGRDFLEPAPAAPEAADAGALAEFQAALVRRKQAAGLYATEFGRVEFLGQHLFRTHVAFPANVPVGGYRIEVFEVRDGAVVNATASALHVQKAGLEAAVFRFAHDFPILHGFVAIAVAMMAGWLAGAAARRV